MELIDEAEHVTADARALGIRQPRGRNLVDIDFAGVRTLEQTGNVQKRRLARAGWRYQRNRLARPAREFGVFEDFEAALALPISPVDRVQEEDRRFVDA